MIGHDGHSAILDKGPAMMKVPERTFRCQVGEDERPVEFGDLDMPACRNIEYRDAIFKSAVRAGAFIEDELRPKPGRGDALEICCIEMKVEETLGGGADGDGALVGVHANSD